MHEGQYLFWHGEQVISELSNLSNRTETAGRTTREKKRFRTKEHAVVIFLGFCAVTIKDVLNKPRPKQNKIFALITALSRCNIVKSAS